MSAFVVVVAACCVQAAFSSVTFNVINLARAASGHCGINMLVPVRATSKLLSCIAASVLLNCMLVVSANPEACMAAYLKGVQVVVDFV